jgi:hypothetical protein
MTLTQLMNELHKIVKDNPKIDPSKSYIELYNGYEDSGCELTNVSCYVYANGVHIQVTLEGE